MDIDSLPRHVGTAILVQVVMLQQDKQQRNLSRAQVEDTLDRKRKGALGPASAAHPIQYSEFPHPEYQSGNELFKGRFRSQKNCPCC
jgi:hypothetical protein